MLGSMMLFSLRSPSQHILLDILGLEDTRQFSIYPGFLTKICVHNFALFATQREIQVKIFLATQGYAQ
jgi:hypothetical protein